MTSNLGFREGAHSGFAIDTRAKLCKRFLYLRRAPGRVLLSKRQVQTGDPVWSDVSDFVETLPCTTRHQETSDVLLRMTGIWRPCLLSGHALGVPGVVGVEAVGMATWLDSAEI